MTDLERFKELYDHLGVPYICDRIPVAFKWSGPSEEKRQMIIIGEGEFTYGGDWSHPESDKLDGYGRFYTKIEFDDDGKFIKQGFWE